jgi:hypothetical protein
MPKRITARLKRVVSDRANGCCEYCLSQERFSPVTFSIEHIIPDSRGGATEAQNLALSCQTCNNHKYTKVTASDPVSHEIVPLFHPRQHVWAEHFIWSDDYTRLLGLTPIGRASIELMRLNRPALVGLRRILRQAGKHPPG